MLAQKRMASGSSVAAKAPRQYNDPPTGRGGGVDQPDRILIDIGPRHCYKVYLTTLNGNKFSYNIPMTIGALKVMLPQLDPELDYNIINGVCVMKESVLLKDADYNLSVVIVKLNLASWCPRKWHIARCVPEEARDNDGYLPSSLDEAGKTIYYVFKSYMNIRGHADGEREDADGEMEHIINHIKYAGWSTWYSSMMNRRAWLKSELGYE